MKLFYTEYVNHCIRTFLRYEYKDLKTDIDRKNWNCVDQVLKRYSDTDFDIILEVFREGYDIKNIVQTAADSRHMSNAMIWKVIHSVEKEIAKERGLL